MSDCANWNRTPISIPAIAGHFKKVRLRAQILRLSQADFGITEIAEQVGKSYNLVRATFHRWQKEGYAGLADHYEHHGRKAVVTEETESHLKAARWLRRFLNRGCMIWTAGGNEVERTCQVDNGHLSL